MPRVARIVLPGVPHHVTQRGNNRQNVFFTDDDRRLYLTLLKENADRFGLAVSAYCLMPNHVHLVATPSAADSLAKAVGRTNFRYAQYLNRSRRRSGHLWQNRFFSCSLQEMHLWRAIRYVERNPVRAQLARLAWRYPWSSAGAHVGEVDASGLLNLAAWRKEWKPGRWAEALRDADDEGVAQLRSATHVGRPLGDEAFLDRLERDLARPVRARPVGRPRINRGQQQGLETK
ncbi:MAG: transposase [Planctomycetota bacterium]